MTHRFNPRIVIHRIDTMDGTVRSCRGGGGISTHSGGISIANGMIVPYHTILQVSTKFPS